MSIKDFKDMKEVGDFAVKMMPLMTEQEKKTIGNIIEKGMFKIYNNVRKELEKMDLI